MTIRPVTVEDAGILLDLMRKIEQERESSLFLPGEAVTTIPEQEEQIRWMQSASNRLLLLVFSGEELAGYVMALGGEFHINASTALVIIEILSGSRRKGLGTAMMQDLEYRARSIPLHRLELTVLASNHAAIAFYESLGFEREGIKRQSRVMGNEYVDEWMMGKLLI